MRGKIAIIGESAGGFLVNYAGTHETPQTRVAAVVDIYGPVDYAQIAVRPARSPRALQHEEHRRPLGESGGMRFFGGENGRRGTGETERDLAPVRGAQGHAPVPGIHGTKDDQVSYEQSTEMCDAMQKWARRAS